MLKFTPRRRLTGGLRLPAHKAESTEAPIRRGLIPPRLVISTRQHRGPAATPVVRVGDEVLARDRIAESSATDGADVHAPTSGRVTAIEPHLVPLNAGVAEELCITVETDGLNRVRGDEGPVALADTIASLVDQIRNAGIVGLGGAVYPTAAKIATSAAGDCRLLVINGAECEPYISCDDMLMREAPEDILQGADMLRRIVGAPECVVAIERDKPQAIDAITAALEKLGLDAIRVAELPSIYPAGGERQLIDVLTGVELDSTHYPGGAGLLCQNVGTAFATYHFFHDGQPLVSRIVTVTGATVAEPGNVEAMIGTPIADLIAFCGGYRDEPERLIQGGSMMGYALPSDDLPVTKSTNCIIAAAATEVRGDSREWPCIRCGECAIACPSRLLPQDLLLAARAHDSGQLDALALTECIECGCCDMVCPSHIPLTETFRQAKAVIRDRDARALLSEASQQRFQSREERREDALAAAGEQRATLKQTLADDQERRREIAAAVARAGRKKPPATDDAG